MLNEEIKRMYLANQSWDEIDAYRKAQGDTRPRTSLRRMFSDEQIKRPAREKVQNGNGKKSTVQSILADAIESLHVDTRLPVTNHKGNPGDEHALLLLSDIQFGVKSTDFNADKAAKRLTRLAEKTARLIELHRYQSPVPVVHVALLGDLIHQDMPYFASPDELELFTIDQVRQLCALLKPFILSLRESAKVVIHLVPGNHGHFGKGSAMRNNFDTLIGNILQLTLPDDIQWNIAHNWYLVARILGWGFLMVHGNQAKSYSGYPWYGVGNKVLRWQTSIQEPFDYVLHGHFHTAIDFPVGDIGVMGNGSFFTKDEYSMQKVGYDAVPAQWLFFVHEKVGITAEYKVWLVDRRPRKR